MPFQVSPGVNVSEIDLTTVVPAVSSTDGAIAGHFAWGPSEERVLVSSEDALVQTFSKPNANTADDFFTAANFLAYGNSLYVVRVVDTATAKNSVASGTARLIQNEDEYDAATLSGSNGEWLAKYPGQLGNSLKVSVCPSAAAFENSVTNLTNYSISRNNSNVVFSNTASTNVQVGDIILLGPDSEPRKIKTISGSTITLTQAYSGNTLSAYTTSLTRRWEYFSNVDGAPTTTAYANSVNAQADEIHVIVEDEDGAITGTPKSVLEVFKGLSVAPDAKDSVGNNLYYKDVINNQSQWIWWNAHISKTNAGTRADLGTTFGSPTSPINDSLTGGVDGDAPGDDDYIRGYNEFASAEDVDISLVLGSGSNQTVAIHLINNIAESRKDCIAILSPERGDVVNNNAYVGKQAQDIVAFRNTLPSSSYAVLDSGFKYQYDKYNDTYRYVPLNGDTAGLMVQTDLTRDPWFSPAGFNRGNVKNNIKLAYNPNKAERDLLYKNGINPVVTFPGQGTVLFGDKTLLAQPSAFDRINVRRLFIVLEKAISTAAKFTLFEFNDDFTRSQFKNLVEPFLRDVQGRRGITDFQVVCDGTNNTGEVIDRNEFIGDIYIKPARSINFIQLNFVAVRTGVDFNEVVGQFG